MIMNTDEELRLTLYRLRFVIVIFEIGDRAPRPTDGRTRTNMYMYMYMYM